MNLDLTKIRIRNRLLVAFTATSLSAVACASAQTPGVATTKTIAEEAFIYGFPLVMNYKVFHDTFLDPQAEGYKGPMNQIHNEARVYTSDDRTVPTPNSDTPYSLLGADLRAEPVVICTPDIEPGRYFSVQMVDMATHNYGYLGTRGTGNEAGCLLVAGPGWEGEKPAGIKQVFRCESPFSMIIFPTQLFNAGDIENMKKVQAGYKVQTLSAFLKQPAPPAVIGDWIAIQTNGLGSKEKASSIAVAHVKDSNNMKKNVAIEPNDKMVFTGNYTEQVTWHDAATGRFRLRPLGMIMPALLVSLFAALPLSAQQSSGSASPAGQARAFDLPKGAQPVPVKIGFHLLAVHAVDDEAETFKFPTSP
ncbi:MAG: DUF1254 domain-containing protein [Verrucomicrobiales bacterium]